MATPNDPRMRVPASRAEGRRDAGLRRVSKLTKRIALVVVAAVGALGLYVSKALPGHTAAPTSQSTSATPNTGSSTGAGPSPGATVLPPTSQPTQSTPVSPPVRTQRPAHVSTGAS